MAGEAVPKTPPAFTCLLRNVADGLFEELTSLKLTPLIYALSALLAFMLISKYLIGVPVIIQMIVYTVPIVLAGSLFALNHHVDRLENPSRTAEVEVMTSRDAMLFPLLASVTLAAIYAAFKYLPKALVNIVLGVHICLAGCYAIGATISSLWVVLNPGTRPVEAVKTIHFPHFLHWLTGNKLEIEVSVARMLGFLVGLFVSISWIMTKAWIFHNVFAICISVHAIRIMSVGTFKTATILLTGLFFYDVFWVFETDVMVTVAKSFDAPVKLLFPTNSPNYGLLGLGDIVIPGVFIAMTLRFDYQRHLDSGGTRYAGKKGMYRPFSKFYFKSSMFAYVCSLCLTGVVMLVWHAAQPALLYLVPSLLVSVYAPALIRGEIAALLQYSEEDKEEDDEEDEDEEDLQLRTTNTATTTTTTTTATTTATTTSQLDKSSDPTTTTTTTTTPPVVGSLSCVGDTEKKGSMLRQRVLH